MSGQMHFLRFSTAPIPEESAIARSSIALGEYMSTLVERGDDVALDALTRLVVERAQERGQYFVLETPQHDG